MTVTVCPLLTNSCVSGLPIWPIEPVMTMFMFFVFDHTKVQQEIWAQITELRICITKIQVGINLNVNTLRLVQRLLHCNVRAVLLWLEC
jgi:hypothetical protein